MIKFSKVISPSLYSFHLISPSQDESSSAMDVVLEVLSKPSADRTDEDIGRSCSLETVLIGIIIVTPLRHTTG